MSLKLFVVLSMAHAGGVAACQSSGPGTCDEQAPAAQTTTCSAMCNQGGHTVSCKDRITWAKDNVKDKSGKPIGLCPAIDLVNGDCSGQCSCQDTDLDTHCGPAPTPTPTPTPPSPGGKFCSVTASKNSCQPCTAETDCGAPRPMMHACNDGKDSGCIAPPPAPPPKNVGFCWFGSKTNACKACATELDCGNSGSSVFSCWDHQDDSCIPSTCGSTCTQGGHASTCKDRVNWAKDNVKDKTGAPIGVCAAITLVNDDCKGQCDCKSMTDFKTDCTPHAGWCKKASKQNGCKGCDSEDDCGNDDSTVFDCQKAKDPSCSGPGPAPAHAGWCKKASKKNGCGGCDGESDCGNDDSSVFDCQKAKDPSCGGPGPAPAGAGWCTREAPSNSCGHCSAESDCGNTASGKYFCQSAKAWNCPMDDIVV